MPKQIKTQCFTTKLIWNLEHKVSFVLKNLCTKSCIKFSGTSRTKKGKGNSWQNIVLLPPKFGMFWSRFQLTTMSMTMIMIIISQNMVYALLTSIPPPPDRVQTGPIQVNANSSNHQSPDYSAGGCRGGDGQGIGHRDQRNSRWRGLQLAWQQALFWSAHRRISAHFPQISDPSEISTNLLR